MFDISFAELIVVAVVMLLVIGPEKLPKVARTFGAYAGRIQRFMAQVKDEVNRETRFEELQKLQQEVKSSVMQTESSIMGHVSQLQADIASSHSLAEETIATKIESTKADLPTEASLVQVSATEAKPLSTSPVLIAEQAIKAKRRAAAKKTDLAIEGDVATKAMPAAKKPRAVKPKSP
ncbi:MAG TPA: Sec-independent protein translocase protein TatB [Methylophilus sp.]